MNVNPIMTCRGAIYRALLPVVPIVTCLMIATPATWSAEKEGFQFKKQPELQQVKPKKPVKIKLKRTAKDEYSWELSGDDVDDILQTDKRLRKTLSAK
ncbi:MAG: hypothetical protein HZB33_15115 [Nitrospirae bacterium]|nr:hypothetical protein [Nitrospirota bacterium]